MYKVIASGSTGNAVLYHGSILIDCGVPFASLRPYINSIQLVCVSHCHLDHMNLTTLKRLALERPSLRFGIGSYLQEYFAGFRNVDIYDPGKWYDYGGFKIMIGNLYHDVPNCFYRIEKNGQKVFHATDTMTLEGITAPGYDLYAIESNYDAETVYNRIKQKEDNGQYSYERAAMNSHLSEQQARDFIFKNRKPESVTVRLHESSILK